MNNRGLGIILLGVCSMLPLGVQAANTKPTVIPQAVTVDEDGQVAITLEGLDVDKDALTYKIGSKPTKGILVLPTGSNIATYKPKANYSGSDKFTFTASDGKSTSTVATVSIMVKAVNDPPLATGQSVKLTEDATGISITLKATDPDSKIAGYTVTVPPAHGAYTQVGAKVTYKPATNYSGADSFMFTASDGSLASAPATVNLTVTAVNDKPVADSQTVTVGSSGASTLTLSGSDADGNALTYLLAKSPKPKGTLSAIFNGNQVKYTPKAGVTSDSFKFSVKDGKLTSALATITIKVEDPPAISITDPFLLQCFGGVAPSTAALTALLTLSCDGVDLSAANLAQLASLPNLRSLDLSHTKLREISGLAGLTKLTSLDLEFNEITDISALAGMVSLTYLNLGFNELGGNSALNALSGMSKLQELYLDANNISNTAALAAKAALTRLSLDDNQITDISVLTGSPALTHVGLGYNQVASATALAGKPLQVVVLDANNLASISGLTGLQTTLQKLYLRSNDLTDAAISSLSGLTNLQELELGFNSISSTSSLASLTNLIRLGLEYNDIPNVITLSGLTKLKDLALEHNQLVSTNGISSMGGLNGLLRLDGNNLLDDGLAALTAMGNSYSLQLDDNCLGNFPFPSRIKVYGEDWQFPAELCGGTAPVATGGDVNILQNTPTTIPLMARDPNGSSSNLVYKLGEVAVTGGSLNASTGSVVPGEVVFTPASGYLKGAGYFKFSVTDGDSQTSPIVTVNLRVVHPLLVSCFGTSNIPADDVLAEQTDPLSACANKNLIDISVLPAYFPKLTTLFLGGNTIADYAPLQQMTNLTGLSLKGNNLDAAALGVISNLKKLTILELDECQLDNADVASLSGLTSLYHLVLNDNDISDIHALSTLGGLITLKLGDSPTVTGNNAITDLEPIRNMTGLQTLILGGNRIGDNQAANLDVLSRLDKLINVDLDDNGLSGVGNLPSLLQLDSLALRYNRLTPNTLDAFKTYPNSLWLYVQQNCLNAADLWTGWPSHVAIDTSGTQCNLVSSQCPPYFDSARSCVPVSKP